MRDKEMFMHVIIEYLVSQLDKFEERSSTNG